MMESDESLKKSFDNTHGSSKVYRIRDCIKQFKNELSDLEWSKSESSSEIERLRTHFVDAGKGFSRSETMTDKRYELAELRYSRGYISDCDQGMAEQNTCSRFDCRTTEVGGEEVWPPLYPVLVKNKSGFRCCPNCGVSYGISPAIKGSSHDPR